MDAQDLTGGWRAHVGTDELLTDFLTPKFDDRDWPTLTVPGHWNASPDFAGHEGPVLYRHRFRTGTSAARIGGATRHHLVLDGAFYFADAWLDGEYLGAADGYFSAHRFEITDAVERGDDHMLAIEVACPPSGQGPRRTLLGAFASADDDDHAPNPGGLWRGVRIETSGPVTLSRLRTLCTEATATRGRLLVDATLDLADAPGAGSGTAPNTTLRALVRAPDDRVLLDATRDVTVAGGDNIIRWELDVDDPPRWWPWRLGEQPVCSITVEVLVDGAPSDRRASTVAFRDVRFDHWVMHVNGERLFTMGSNLGPVRQLLATAYPEEFDDLVRVAVEANLDLLRIRAHVSRPELYAAADRRGLLLWQDLPLLGTHARSVRRPALRQAADVVDVLGHHPSVALWCAHDEPYRPVPPPGVRTRRAALRSAVSRYLPSWNKDVLDRSIVHALHKADPSRAAIRNSGVLPGVGSTGTDTHVGVDADRARDLPRWFRRIPSLARFVTARGGEPAGDPRGHAAVVQLQIEDLRRIMYVPTGGFAHSAFADDDDRRAGALLNPTRTPTRAYTALRDACRTVLPMVDPRTGTVHVANSGRVELADAGIEIVGRDATSAVAFTLRYTGIVGADAVTYVGRVPVELVVPTGTVAVTLTRNDGLRIANRYAPELLALAAAAPHPA